VARQRNGKKADHVHDHVHVNDYAHDYRDEKTL
jgi:hypothetical protein